MGKQYRLTNDEFELIQTLRTAGNPEISVLHRLLINESLQLLEEEIEEIKKYKSIIQKAINCLQEGKEIEDKSTVIPIVNRYLLSAKQDKIDTLDNSNNVIESLDIAYETVVESIDEDLNTASFYSSLAKSVKKIKKSKL